MKLSTRLLVPLLPTVAVVMFIYAAWAVRQRQKTLLPQTRSETQVYATALSLALEYAFRDGKLDDVQDIINEIGRQPEIYGVLIYDSSGRQLFTSGPPGMANAQLTDSLLRVLAGAEMIEFEHRIDEASLYSVLRPLHDTVGVVIGILEVAQPLTFVDAETARVGKRFLLNTITLVAALTVLILWLVRRSISRPLQRLVDGIRTVGRGDLSHRLREDPAGGELAELAREFNGMAMRLEAAQLEVVRENEERVGLERRLREAEKMAAIGNLAARVAHQIAAPLNVIGGRAEKLMKSGSRDPVDEKNLQIISAQAERIAAIVNKLLRFARRPRPRLEVMDATAVLADVLELLEDRLADAGIELRWEDKGSLWLRGDRDLLQQVFEILLINSVQALEEVEGERRVEIRSRVEGSEIVIEVRDNGNGIPDDLIDRVFEPFFSTKVNGTGLGLAIARTIVEELDGRLEAASPNSGGTLLRLTVHSAPRPEHAHA